MCLFREVINAKFSLMETKSFSNREGGTKYRLSKVPFLTPHSYLIPKKGSFVKLFVNVFTPWRAVA